MKHFAAPLMLTLCTPFAAFAASDKDQYDFFNPTPVAEMRDMSTDRPDKTESAYTVDAGHYQIEMDVMSFTRNHDKIGGSDEKTSDYGLATTNFKAGLTNNTDLQLVVESYTHSTTDDRIAGTSRTSSGFGDVTVRLKHNLWGNDGGTTALALMPFVKVPTNQDHLGNDSVEGGLIVPLAVDLGNGYGLGLMTELDINRDADDNGYHAGFVNSVTISTELCENMGGYAEFFTSRADDTDAHWENTLDFGVTYAATDNIQLDAGINIGVTDAADDYNPFVGATFRF